jgi:5-methylcytosine-specific restriction protein A
MRVSVVSKWACDVRLTDEPRTARERGYSTEWDKRSAHFKKRFPMCGMRPNNQAPVMSACYAENRISPAEETDHVIPHRGDQRLFWDEAGNWQALCRPCHRRKTKAGL